MERRIRREAEVKDAVVFGIDKLVPGLLIFRANTASNLSELEQWIISTFSDRPGIPIQNRESGFDASGVDSLKAMQMRGLIINT